MARRDEPDRDAFGRPVVRRPAEAPRAAPAPPRPAPPRDEPQEHGYDPRERAAAEHPLLRPVHEEPPGSPWSAGPWSDTASGDGTARAGGGAPGSGTWSAPERSGWSPPAEQARTVATGDATAALLFGIASLVFLPFVLSFPAIIYGRRARRAARDLPGRPGWGSATWGLCLGWFTLVWPVLIVLLLIVGLAAGTDS